MHSAKFKKQYLRDRNSEVGNQFELVPQHEWPKSQNPPLKIWRNRHFFVQLYQSENGTRISVNRTSAKGFKKDGSPNWNDAVTWDELQSIKSAIGYGDRWAVECYPPESEVINVANMRHLWLLDEPPGYGWKKNAEF